MDKERGYEMTLILDSGLEDEQVDERIKNLDQKITDAGGGVEDVLRWGKRRLTYPIKKKESGNYLILTFKSNPDQLPELERGLKLDEQVLRYLIIHK